MWFDYRMKESKEIFGDFITLYYRHYKEFYEDLGEEMTFERMPILSAPEITQMRNLMNFADSQMIKHEDFWAYVTKYHFEIGLADYKASNDTMLKSYIVQYDLDRYEILIKLSDVFKRDNYSGSTAEIEYYAYLKQAVKKKYGVRYDEIVVLMKRDNLFVDTDEEPVELVNVFSNNLLTKPKEDEKIMELAKLFSLDNKENTKEWEVSVYENDEKHGIIVTKYGKVGGNIRVVEKAVKKGKNIGKSNETTPFEQACNQAKSTWQKKVDEGGVEDPEKAEIPKFPMLATNYSDRKKDIVYPALVQPKLDGIRCFAKVISETEVQFTTRKGKPIETLGHLVEEILGRFKVGDVLDGEIYVHGKSFQWIIRNVKKLRETSAELEFHMYDMIPAGCEEMPFVDRYDHLNESFYEYGSEKLQIVQTETILSEKNIKDHFDDIIEDGYEGMMFRNRHGLYKFSKRSKDLQKYKEFEDAEFKIIGGFSEEGEYVGCVVFEVQGVLNGIDVEFKVRPRGSVEQRQIWYRNLESLKGKDLTVRYQGVSEEGVPRFPVGIAIRDYE